MSCLRALKQSINKDGEATSLNELHAQLFILRNGAKIAVGSFLDLLDLRVGLNDLNSKLIGLILNEFFTNGLIYGNKEGKRRRY